MSFNNREIKNLLRGNPLVWAGVGGFIIVLALAWILLSVSITRDPDVFPQTAESDFSRELGNYDRALGIEKPEALGRRLDRLEKKAQGQEQWLSTLKRRRNLVQTDSRFLPPYQKSAREALEAFPHSEVMAVVAGDSLIQDPAYGQNIDLLRNYAGRVSQPQFAPMALSLYVLSGDLGNPGPAAAIPGIESLIRTELPQELKEPLLVDEILLGILRGETTEAAARVNELLREYPLSEKLLALGGEFFYHYGNPLRGAELFTRLGENSRAADALALAGETPGARNIWAALSSSPSGNSDTQARSLYNLAASSANEQEAASWLEKISALPRGTGEPFKVLGLIRYSRLQTTPRSVAILEEGKENPLVDLELLRRQMETMPLDRCTAEVWLLLGRHPDEEGLYQWAAWYFDKQKLYAETAQALKIAARHGINSPWLNLCRGLAMIREGNTGEGVKILEEEYKKNPSGDWRFPANLGRVLESQRSVSAALASYETASELSQNPRDTSAIRLRISRCLEALGRKEESREALDHALSLDPDNFEAASLIRRLERP